MSVTMGNGWDTGGFQKQKLVLAEKVNAQMKFRLKKRCSP